MSVPVDYGRPALRGSHLRWTGDLLWLLHNFDGKCKTFFLGTARFMLHTNENFILNANKLSLEARFDGIEQRYLPLGKIFILPLRVVTLGRNLLVELPLTFFFWPHTR